MGQYASLQILRRPDSVEKYCTVLIQFGIPMKQVRLIEMCLNKTYSKVCIGKNLLGAFPIQNGMKQGDALFLLLFISALEYSIGKIQENQENLELNGTLKVLVYADDVDMLLENINTLNKTQKLCKKLVVRLV